MRLSVRLLGAVLAGLLLLIFAAFEFLYRDFEPGILNPGLLSRDTPAKFGVPFERVAITSGARQLDAFLVPAADSCRTSLSILVYHGVGETIADWIAAQKLLRAHCIASMVFDYSGHGASSPGGSFRHLDEDAEAAYAAYVRRVPPRHRCVMSFSMGAGPMLDVFAKFNPLPDCVIVASAFTSLRDFAAAHGTRPILLFFYPNAWDNEQAITRIHAPLLIVHSLSDHTNPYWMGRRLFAAANEPKHLVTLRGFGHNAPYRKPSDDWWRPVIDFVSRTAGPAR